MKYKKGDLVKIKSNLKDHTRYGNWFYNSDKYPSGSIHKIISVTHQGYYTNFVHQSEYLDDLMVDLYQPTIIYEIY